MNNGSEDDKFEGVYYSTKYSEKTHAITVTIKSLTAFNQIESALKDLYNFSKNKNGNGIEAHFTFSNKNVALSLYNNKTLFIQGSGCWLWKSSVFNRLDLDLLDKETKRENSDKNSKDSMDTPVTTPADSDRSNKSPLVYLSNMISNLRHSRSKKTQETLNKQSISSLSTPRIDRSSVSTSLSKDTEQTFVKERFSSANPSNDHQTLVKELFKDDSYDIDSIMNDELSSPDHTMTTTTATGEDSREELEATGEHYNGAESTDSTGSRSKQSETESQLLEKMKENAVLQETLKELLTQSRQLKAENDRLLDLNACKENDIKMLESKVQVNVDKVKELDQNLSRVKSELADANAKILIYEEDSKKVQSQVNDITKEKAKLLDEIMRLRGCNDAMELKIEKSAEGVENSVVGEIKDLKDLLIKEISDLRVQISKSQEQTKERCVRVELSKETSDKNKDINGKPIPVIVNHQTTQSELSPDTGKKRAFVAGDSITRILSPAKMSDSNLEVRVKSHPGGRVQNVKNTLKKFSETDSEFVKSLDVVVLHVGTNNVSDAECGDQIVNNFKDTISSLNTLNPKAKIIVSSILPRRNDRLVNDKIYQTNKALQNMCDKNGHHFLDNSTNLGNPSQYRDNIHLNPRGGKVLGNNMTGAIGAVLGLPPVASSTEAEDTSFRKGRSPGRRDIYQSQRQMYVMPMTPYWMGGQSPWPFQNHPWY